jgi:hypothetical protein
VSVRKGEPWGVPASGPPDREIEGSDAQLAQWVATAPGALVRFRPDASSDVARAVGLNAPEPAGTELTMDALELADGSLAVNMVVFGVPPDRLRRFSKRVEMRARVDDGEWFAGRATTVLCAVGQWLRGHDVVPRGHPGDGRAEMQAYRLRPPERAAMRSRLRTGGHVPHPRILQRSGRRLEIEADTAVPLEVDGIRRTPASRLVARVTPGAYRLLV